MTRTLLRRTPRPAPGRSPRPAAPAEGGLADGRPGDSSAAVRLLGVGKTFDTVAGDHVEALTPVTMSIGDGELVSVVGPSGCGKTTLLRILAGIETATCGSAEIGHDVVRGPRRDVGTVFQRPELLEWRTVRANVLLPVEVQRRSIERAGRTADDLLEASGLSAFAGSYPHELSGGMQQRVAIARALVIEPRVLLLDEPFGALDALTRERMNLHLASICDRQRISTLLITHSFDEAVLLSDRVIVLSERPGRIMGEVAVDLPRPRSAETLRAPRFAELVGQVRAMLGLHGTPAHFGADGSLTSAPDGPLGMFRS